MAKRFFIGLFILLLPLQSISAQGFKKNVEFSIAGSLQAHTYENETVHLLNFPLRVGVFLTPNLEFEVEGIFTVLDEQLSCDYQTDVGFIASGNLSYNFDVTERVIPFILAGYGLSNSEPWANTFITYGDDDLTLGVLNLGAGFKFPVGKRSAFRVDYRFQDFSGERERYGRTYDIDFQIHSLQFGLSLFL